MSNQFKLRWPVDDPRITQRFGENPDVYAKYGQAGHEGVDFGVRAGSAIYACADGEVTAVHPNDGNAYGLHVRIRHPFDGREYQTIYAHLSESLASGGQWVSAGERIALSGNTGHSTGPHLHLTLKLIGAKTPGYPDGIIDPLPYFGEVEVPAPSDLTLYTTEPVRLRAGPTTASAQLAWLSGGEALAVLGDAGSARAKVGERDQWIQVQRADGLVGFVAAWYLQLQPPAQTPAGPETEAEPTAPLVVYATEPLNVRKGPSTGTSRIAIALPHEPLTVAGDRAAAVALLGDRGEWLRVSLPDGSKGYVAAWYVQTEPGAVPAILLTVYPTEDMNMRESPTVKAGRVARPAHNTPLTIHDDAERARVLVGRYDEWLYVETPEGKRGWAAAWYVSTTPT